MGATILGLFLRGTSGLHMVEFVTSPDPLSPEECRVIACLVEKGATTPDSYPLTTNSLRLACNQATSRDPVVDYSDRQIDALMLTLRQRGLARTLSGSGHRVSKHRHIADEALGLSGAEVAVLAVLLLRGAQTVAELLSRTARYADGPEDAAAVESAIDSLAAREEPFTRRLSKRPGEREPRIEQVWAPAAAAESAPESAESARPEPATGDAWVPEVEEPVAVGDAWARGVEEPVAAEAPVSAAESGGLEARVSTLEAALAEQTRRLDALLAQLGD